MPGFYPRGKPATYSYTEHFMEVGHDVNQLARKNTKYPGLDGDDNRQFIIEALNNLQILIDGARNAETAFIRDTGINLNSGSPRDIFNAINIIFNSKETFERGLQAMERLSGPGPHKEEEMHRDITRFFLTYFRQIVKQKIGKASEVALRGKSKQDVEKLVNDIITETLTRSYTRVHDFIKENGDRRLRMGNARARNEEQEIQAIQDMIPIIQELGKSGAFSQFGYLFDLDIDDLIGNNNQELVNLKSKSLTGDRLDARFGGNALELITSTVAARIAATNIQNPNLTIRGVHTGRENEMKADTMLFVGRGGFTIPNYSDFIDRKSDSVRTQNVDALKKYLNSLSSNIDHVIMVSDKNYSITSTFSGITAQEDIKLKHAGELLSRFNVRQVDDLVNYLANCGDQMVHEQVVSEVRTELQTYIAYFLFDNLEVKSNGQVPNINVVNLINVSGLYIPLSTYLEGLKQGIQGVLATPSSFVSLSISLGGDTEGPVWTQKTWNDFRKTHEEETTLSYRILRDMADFIINL